MIYKVRAQGKLPEIKSALEDAFFGQYKIERISRPDRKGLVTIEIRSSVSITCLVEPITGIELKFDK